MPRNIRNFWLEGRIDGRKNVLAGGPQSKDGGFRLTIKQRSSGEVIKAVEIEGFVSRSGELILMVDVEGQDAVRFVTER